MNANPYAAPETLCVPGAETATDTRRLFTTNHVALAAFLGSPLGGATVLAINFARLGKMPAAVKTVALGAIASAMIISMAMLIPLPTGMGALLGLAYAFTMRTLTQRLQGDAIEAHASGGGTVASVWSAAGIGVLVSLLQLSALVAAGEVLGI